MSEELYLIHYGIKRRSGRWRYGSGENPYQHEPWFPGFGQGEKTFRQFVEECRKKGMKDSEIAEMCGLVSWSQKDKKMTPSVSLLRKQYSISRATETANNISKAMMLANSGMNTSQIAREMGRNESTIRDWLKEDNNKGITQLMDTANRLKDAVDDKGIIQVGSGVEAGLGVTATKMGSAIQMLVNDGYVLQTIQVKQLGTQYKTNVKVLAPPGTTIKDLYDNADKISTLEDYDTGANITTLGMRKPESLDSSRMLVLYAEDGGTQKDGLIEIRRGVEDLSLGDSNYAQVRIAVDDKMYLKGMAVYSDHIPEGYDVVVNSNKPKEKGLYDNACKPLKDNPDNPFGATIKNSLIGEDGLLKGGQSEYIGKDGQKHLSLINKVEEEGYWGGWSKTLASQMLAKQDINLIERQLNLSIKEREQEVADIMSVTNPTLRKIFLEEFGDECDSAAVELKAAALPRQASRVIFPVNSLKEDEIYAPSYRDGESVCLIRYPHGGTFEIPQLVVNNKNKEGREMLGDHPLDAVGINRSTAQHLSGADFDGDTVIVIPVNDNVRIEHKPYLSDLIGFDPDAYYSGEHVRTIQKVNSKGQKVDREIYVNNVTGKEYERLPKSGIAREMGNVTNLITDMTTAGSATDEEIARAVRHSMVVIDAHKHKYDYKQSYEDNGIAELKLKYQGTNSKGQPGGAGTLFSRASSEDREPKMRLYSKIDPETGERIYTPTGETKTKVTIDPVTGKKVYTKTDEIVLQKTTKMATHKDAKELMSGPNHEGTVKELAYAEYANTLKAMGNQTRLASVKIKEEPVNKSAVKIYADEVESVMYKLAKAEANSPRERQAQLWANAVVKEQLSTMVEPDKEQIKKLNNQALNAGRIKFGAEKQRVLFTDREIEAINANAFNKTTLKKIYDNCEKDELKKQLMPKKSDAGLSTADMNLIKSMANSHYTIAEIADRLGVSTSTVSKYINA